MIIYECDRCREQQQSPLTRCTTPAGLTTELCDQCLRMYLPRYPHPRLSPAQPPKSSRKAPETEDDLGEVHFDPELDAKVKARSPHLQRVGGMSRTRPRKAKVQTEDKPQTPRLTGIAPEDRKEGETK